MAGRLEFEFQVGRPKRGASFGDEPRLRILLMGDFSGRAGHADAPTEVAARPLLRVDADNFDSVMAKLKPRVMLVAGDDSHARQALEFTSLDAFHPDQLAPRLEALPGFRAERARVLEAQGRAAEAATLPSAPAAGASDDGEEDTLARLLGERLPPLPASGVDITKLLEHVVAAHVTSVDPRLEREAAAGQQAMGGQLRDLLHEPVFQRLEAAWRAVHRLVHSVESEDLIFTILDVTPAELAADLATGVAGSGLQSRLQDAHPAWSMLILDQSFGPHADDMALLDTLGALAKETGAPLITAANPRVPWGALAPDDAQRWQSLRRGPHASSIALALPRWLVRLPYGPKSDAIESFDFDELEAGRDHESYLWGNPAYACALLAAAAFRQNGAEMSLGDVRELDRMPCHSFRVDGEVQMQPCAEVFMNERTASALLAAGLTPLASVRDRDVIRILRFQSIADPPTALAGPWK